MRPLPFILSACLFSVLTTACQHAPETAWLNAPEVQERCRQLETDLLALLPQDERCLPEAKQEAHWLADTSFRASVAIAAINDPLLWPAWLNNRLVNSPGNIRERGLCWHYQQDLYRELRRRPLSFFRIGFCVKDQGRGSEHNCVYLAAQKGEWPHALILDAWRKNGRLVVMDEKKIIRDEWQDSPEMLLDRTYPEGHTLPIEHWASVKSGVKWNLYYPSWTPEGRSSRQGILMYENMAKGLRERHGKPTNY